jgi:hypothetical protein
MLRYLFTAQQAEEKFGPDLEFRLSHRALAKKAKREAAAAAAAQAAAARLREEELGGVVDPRRPKKQKTTARDAAATAAAPPGAEKKGAKSKNGQDAVQRGGDDGDAEDTRRAVAKKDKEVKAKSALECEAPRSYPDSVAWGGEQGVVLDGRIAAAISDMVCDFAVASPALAVNIATIYIAVVVSYSPRRPLPPPCPFRAPSSPVPFATASTSSGAQRPAAAKRWRMLCL